MRSARLVFPYTLRIGRLRGQAPRPYRDRATHSALFATVSVLPAIFRSRLPEANVRPLHEQFSDRQNIFLLFCKDPRILPSRKTASTNQRHRPQIFPTAEHRRLLFQSCTPRSSFVFSNKFPLSHERQSDLRAIVATEYCLC